MSVTTNPAVATIRNQMPLTALRNNLFSIDRTRTLIDITIYEGLNDLCTVLGPCLESNHTAAR